MGFWNECTLLIYSLSHHLLNVRILMIVYVGSVSVSVGLMTLNVGSMTLNVGLMTSYVDLMTRCWFVADSVRMITAAMFPVQPMNPYAHAEPTMMQRLQAERRKRLMEYQQRLMKGEDWPGFDMNPVSPSETLWDNPPYQGQEWANFQMPQVSWNSQFSIIRLHRDQTIFGG